MYAGTFPVNKQPHCFPVVTDPAIRPILNTPEVAALFSLPLQSLLSSEPLNRFMAKASPSPTEPQPTQSLPYSSVAASTPVPEYHTYVDISWGKPDTHVRIHKFLTGREPNMKPLVGLTAAILLCVASIGYGLPPFDIEAPDQLSMKERIAYALSTVPILVEACKKEGIYIRRSRQTSQVDHHSMVRSKL
ncbi:hypothetical protein FRB99_007127 [Tulasnella sp. 403]|nr:hypothetical protein FRB99_007127 [Tulasnella sp. 403]